MHHGAAAASDQERFARQRSALIALTNHQVFHGGEVEDALHHITETAARTLEVERVGVWLYDEDRSAIVCHDLFERTPRTHSSGVRLVASAFPTYFRALQETDIIAADEAATDPRTREFVDDYLTPLGIGAMLDAPISLGGVRAGVLCHEHVGPARRWTDDEITFAVALSHLVSLVLEQHQRRQAEHRFRSLIEYSADGLVLVDADHTVLYASPSASAIEGRSLEELVGSNGLEHSHPDDLRLIEETVEKLKADPATPIEVTWRRRHRDGHWLWLEGVASNQLDDPALGALVINYRDVTVRRRLEEQLLQSQKLEAIGRLAGGVAHDFNNILTVIQGYAAMLLTFEEVPEEGLDAGRMILESAERASNLTRQLLAFSRRQVLQPGALDLNTRVRDLTSMLERTLGEDVSLRLELEPDPLTIRADAGMIDQVLLNLVVNARDAMPRGGSLLIRTEPKAVTAEPDLQPGRYARLEVTDTGCGIEPQHLAHIFEPFFSTKEPGHGTGLGLSTVFGVVKQHGGSLRVDSAPGRGTTFEILFPLHASQPDTVTPRKDSSPLTAGHETILLVEDEPTVRRLAKRVLERAGYRVLDAALAGEALELFERHQDEIRLLFTDIVMPGGVNGLQLANDLRARAPQLKVLFTSGYSADIAGQELALEGDENYLQEPALPQEMLAAVRHCLDA